MGGTIDGPIEPRDVNMENLRLAPVESVFPRIPCCRCADGARWWDRIAGKTYCPHCLEALALGEAEPMVEKTDRRRCSVCHRQGTLRFLTFPLHSRRPVEMDLCAEHLRAMVARRLGPHSFEQLRRQLQSLNIRVNDVFLLHEAFYDEYGRALQPAVEW
jgi:transposase-like protein